MKRDVEREKSSGSNKVGVRVYKYAGYTEIEILTPVDMEGSEDTGYLLSTSRNKTDIFVASHNTVENGGISPGQHPNLVYEFPAPRMRSRFLRNARSHDNTRNFLDRFNLKRLIGIVKRNW